jgi:uncharacterized protein
VTSVVLARPDDSEDDAGPRDAARERFCIVTRSVKPIDDLIRFVVGPDGGVVPDLKRKLPGRGVWVSAERAVLATAVSRKAFGRSFRREVKVDPGLVDLVDQLLECFALDALSMAHKAGRLVSGFTQVEAALRKEPVAALIHASDAQPDGVRKLAAAQRRTGAADEPEAIGLFTSAQLDLALGRSNVVHAALLAGPASHGFLARCRSLARFRSGGGGASGTKTPS